MQIRVSQSDGIPLYQQIVNQVKYLVAAGRFATDARSAQVPRPHDRYRPSGKTP